MAVLSTGTLVWKRSGGSFANAPGATVIYDNTCTWAGGGFFGSADSCETIYDEGRIPTCDPNDPVNARTTQLTLAYTFCGFTFSYCTGEPTLNMDFTFTEAVGGACAGPFGPASPDLAVALIGLPASNGVQQACWNITIDLSNNANGGFCINGNGDTVFDDPATDLFGWSWAPADPTTNTANPTGLFISGEPATVVTGGENTFDIAPATDPVTGGPCGSGLDSTDNFWINIDTGAFIPPCTTPTGCYFFGGYPGNPFASWDMSMVAVPKDKETTWETYCVAKPSGSGCLANAFCCVSGSPVSLDNDFEVCVEGVEGNRPGILFGANTAPATIPFQGSGTLCMFPPLRRGPIMFSFGTPNACDGSFAQIINDASFPGGFDPGPGNTGYYQSWYRDPNVADTGTALSNAVEVLFQP